jgi:ADP-dependent NAD(P)H-hydrate dehydratase / NAD(P)H-hydrate epimerase
MRPVLPLTDELALHDAAQTRVIEQRAAAVLPAHALMRRAGESVAHLALALAPHAQRFWVACGPGNNGGDGLEAAVQLHRLGKQVEVALLADAAALPADAADALGRARAAGLTIGSSPQPGDAPQLAIDALLGVGAHRAPAGSIVECIGALNALACTVLAVDLPSGLNAATGQPNGSAAVIAQNTLALLTLKPGLFTGAGRDHAGRVWIDSLGAGEVAETVAPAARLSGLARRSPRLHAQHKGSFGDVAVVGGAPGMQGAALLAARAAHAAGAGRVYIELLGAKPADARLDVLRPELMFRDGWSRGSASLLERSTVACGCGGSDLVRAVLPRLMSRARRLVIDADALTALAADTALAALLRTRAARGLATILTPHPLEAARLLGCSTVEVQADRLEAARELAQRFACVAVLKGSGTIVASPDETPRINSTGNASLATAGTGDVLAGWLAGRWAATPAGEELAAAFVSARQAVAEHGAAAEPQPLGALRAGDLIERLYAGESPRGFAPLR